MSRERTTDPAARLPHHPTRTAALILLFSWPACGVLAEEGDRFTPYVTYSHMRDSNLFRVSGDAEAQAILGTTETADTVHRYTAGFKTDLPVERQRFRLDANVDKTKFDRFDFLDNTGGKGRAVWDWRVGNHWNGDLGYTYTRNISEFVEFQQAVKDIRTQDGYFVSAAHLFHPSWQARAAGSKTDTGHSADSQRTLNQDATGMELGLHYTSPKGSRTGLTVKRRRVEFPEREVVSGSLFDNGYREWEYSAVLDWALTGKSWLKGRAGYTDREHDQLPARDFSGATGRLTHDWQPTGKLRLETSLWREISAYEDYTASYIVEQGAGLAPSWRPTALIGVGVPLSRKKREFKGDPGFALSGLPVREDKVRTYGINLTYQPWRKVDLSLAHLSEKRSSTRVLDEYRVRVLSGSLQVSF
jgi:exopolysaccharide biosynthesis operon protein EpsL